MTNRYRAGQPADLHIDFAGDEPKECPMAPIETPLRARIMDACADALEWVLDRLWVGAVVLMLGVAVLVWSMS